MTTLLQELKLYIDVLRQRKRVELDYLRLARTENVIELVHEYRASTEALEDIIAELEGLVKRYNHANSD